MRGGKPFFWKSCDWTPLQWLIASKGVRRSSLPNGPIWMMINVRLDNVLDRTGGVHARACPSRYSMTAEAVSREVTCIGVIGIECWYRVSSG